MDRLFHLIYFLMTQTWKKLGLDLSARFQSLFMNSFKNLQMKKNWKFYLKNLFLENLKLMMKQPNQQKRMLKKSRKASKISQSMSIVEDQRICKTYYRPLNSTKKKVKVTVANPKAITQKEKNTSMET